MDTLTPRQSEALPMVRGWLFFVAFLVFCMVIVGGATRLTDSGLSITEWQPLLGAIPPLSEADWLEAFEKYKLIPEYHLVNSGMSLSASASSLASTSTGALPAFTSRAGLA